MITAYWLLFGAVIILIVLSAFFPVPRLLSLQFHARECTSWKKTGIGGPGL